MTTREQYLDYNGDSVNLQQWWQHAQYPRKLKPDKIPEQMWGSGEEAPTLAEELVATDNYEQRYRWFSLKMG